MRAFAILLVAFHKQRQHCTGRAIERLQSMPRRPTSLPESSFAAGLQG